MSEGIPYDMDVIEHRPEVETSDEDEDSGSEASEECHGERADNTQMLDVAGSLPGQVNLLSPAVRNRPRRETGSLCRFCTSPTSTDSDINAFYVQPRVLLCTFYMGSMLMCFIKGT